MKFYLFLILNTFALSQSLVINEIVSSNSSIFYDEDGDTPDWVEIYNDTSDPIDIGGMYFTDTPDDDNPYQIPNTDPSVTTIPPKGYLVIWCDDDQEQGPLHVSKKLKKSGESIILLSSDKITVIDSSQIPTLLFFSLIWINDN